MKNNIFIVIKVTGESFRLTTNKLVIPIKVGDTISEGEIIVVKDGSVSLQDTSGAPIEIPQNTALMLHEDGVFAETPESVILLSTDISTGVLSSPLSSEVEPDSELDQEDADYEVVKDGHSHVRLERIHYEYGSDYHKGRDTNETNIFEIRATRNPRINFKYEHPEQEEEFPRVDVEDSYSRDGWTSETSGTSGWFNRAPEVSALSVITDEDIALTLDLLKNAIDPEGHPMKILSATALHGTVIINPDGTVTYTPNEDYHGSDTITYKVTDIYGGVTEATVKVTVNPIQDAFDDANTTDEDTPVTLDVMLNDTFGPNAILTSVTQGSNGTVTFDKYGNVTYTPGDYFQSLTDGETATDTFTYTVTTAGGNTETATVTITITGKNDAPLAIADINTVYEDAEDQAGHDDSNPATTIVAGNVLTNDSDIDSGDVINVTGVAAGIHSSASGSVATAIAGTYGTVVINADGTYIYTLDNSRADVQALANGQEVT
ncbi:MAG: tandem-95 repeat protein, partial [Clostridiaceae bacterium]|nr:tandem-95 repeat protein [Clostridiaceae bacterium]